MKKICIITTISLPIDQFIRFCFEDYRKDGFDVSVLCDMDQNFIASLPDYIHPLPVRMRRGISLSGIAVVFRMYRIMRKEKFSLVQYSTPNASLYASIATYLAGVPVRLYCQWGMIFVSFTGVKRFIFKLIERLICALSTDVQPDSHGNLKLCRSLGFYTESKSRVVWNGSANGLDLKKFDVSRRSMFREEIRKQVDLGEGIVIGFLGRLMRDKGFNELIAMYKILKAKYPEIRMLFVGPTERTTDVDQELLHYFYQEDSIIKTGGVPDAERYLSAMDLFVFPSYREGFGSVVIEAQAMGCPVVITDIPGPTDGVKKNVTGFVVPVKTIQPLVDAASVLIDNPALRNGMGEKAVSYVCRRFDNCVLAQKIIENRNWLLQNRV